MLTAFKPAPSAEARRVMWGQRCALGGGPGSGHGQEWRGGAGQLALAEPELAEAAAGLQKRGSAGDKCAHLEGAALPASGWPPINQPC